MALLRGGVVLVGVSRDEVGYQVVNSVGDAVGSHGCIVTAEVAKVAVVRSL